MLLATYAVRIEASPGQSGTQSNAGNAVCVLGFRTQWYQGHRKRGSLGSEARREQQVWSSEGEQEGRECLKGFAIVWVYNVA